MSGENGNANPLFPGVILGKNAVIDDGVKLGYRTGRRIADHTLRIGDGACIRSGTVIYGGTDIGNGLATGHNVTIREENQIGDNFNVWNCTTIDYGCKIGNNVKIHCNCYIAQFTVVEDNAFMAPGVTIANDIHPGCEFSGKVHERPAYRRGSGDRRQRDDPAVCADRRALGYRLRGGDQQRTFRRGRSWLAILGELYAAFTISNANPG